MSHLLTMDSHLQPSATIKDKYLVQRSSLQKPEILGVFSSDRLSETGIRLDASNCKYIKKQLLTKGNCSIDLKVYNDIRKENENKDSESTPTYQPMTLFLEYLEKLVTQDTFVKSNENKLFPADIICHSRLLVKMMMVHGDANESFSLLCTKYKGNIYICKRRKSQEKRKDPIKNIVRHALCSGT